MKLTDELIRICEIQANIFTNAGCDFSCGSSLFVFRFMNSKLAKEMDDPHFMSGFSLSSYKDALLEQYPFLNVKKGKKINSKIMHWIGYIYRATSYALEISSKELITKMKFDQLTKLYNVYHTYGVDYCVEKLNEHFKLSSSKEDKQKKLIKSLYKNTFLLI